MKGHLARFQFLFSLKWLIFLGSWLLGICLAWIIFRHNSNMFLSLTYTAQLISINPCVLTLQFFIYIFVLYLFSSNFGVVCLLALLKSFLYCIPVFSIWGAYKDAGWLAQFLFLFSNNCLTAILCYLLSRSVLDKSSLSWKQVVCFLLPGLFVIIIDYFYISPFIKNIYI